MTRYPFSTIAPLLADMTTSDVAQVAGVSVACVGGWRRRDSDATITEDQADRLATHLAMHPAEIWPEWQADITGVCDDCGSRFVRVRRDQRFCSTPCRIRCHNREYATAKRESRRRRYRQDPAARERYKQNRRRYYAENGEYERARERRRYQATKAQPERQAS